MDPDSVALEQMRERSGLPLPLRILALVGALSFVLIGISSLIPPTPPEPSPPRLRQQRDDLVLSRRLDPVTSAPNAVSPGD